MLNALVVVVANVVDAALPGVTVQAGALANCVPNVMEHVVPLVKVTFPPRSPPPTKRANPVHVAATGGGAALPPR
jgi:hypothetical protein